MESGYTCVINMVYLKYFVTELLGFWFLFDSITLFHNELLLLYCVLF